LTPPGCTSPTSAPAPSRSTSLRADARMHTLRR
jgi:hypothetical protein